MLLAQSTKKFSRSTHTYVLHVIQRLKFWNLKCRFYKTNKGNILKSNKKE